MYAALALFIACWAAWRATLRRRNELETIVASVAPDVLLVTGPDRTIRLANPAVATMFGYRPEDILGSKTDVLYSDRRPVDDRSEIRDNLRKFGFHIGSARGRRRDDSALPLEIVTGKLRGRSGAVLLIRDVTERVRLEEMRQDLIHMLVHDLKSPLAGIGFAAAAVQRLAADRLEVRETAHLARIGATTSRLAEMVRSILDVARLEDGRLPLHPTSSEFREICMKVAVIFEQEAEQKHVSIVIPDNAVTCWCDPDLISRVLANLVGNAVKFAPEHSEIRIAAEAEPLCTRVSVTDDGQGVPPEFRERIFERFSQMEAREYSTGLGLTFCKLAVVAHGGDIGVSSEQGKGSTFWFTLPNGR